MADWEAPSGLSPLEQHVKASPPLGENERGPGWGAGVPPASSPLGRRLR